MQPLSAVGDFYDARSITLHTAATTEKPSSRTTPTVSSFWAFCLEDYYEVKEQRYLGEDEFVEGVEKVLKQEPETRPVKITMADVAKAIARGSGHGIGMMLGQGRGRAASRLRAQAAYVAREVGGLRLTEAAKYLKRDPSTVSLAVTRLEEQMQSDPKLRQRLEDVSIRLRRGRSRQYQIIKA